MSQLEFYSHKANDVTSDNGPRTAAVLTFSGNTNDSFVKELTQNSLDARVVRGENLKIKVSYREVPKLEIPNFTQFENILSQMESYWNAKSDQYKRFFETSKGSIKGSKVKILVFEDSLTKGLRGDDMKGTFKNCVNDENVSGKEHSDSLGNHGIGKNSVFGYSGVHTVFYSSLNIDGEYKFKGVSKLGNYKDQDGVKRSERIYYGAVEGESVRLLDDQMKIPECFRREEVGLSQFVIGAEVNDDWAENVKKAFISNYWFLFESEKLEVDIDGVILNKSNYESEAKVMFADDKSRNNPLPFIKSYREVQIHVSEKIFKIGTVNFFAREALEGESFPNRVAFLRDGMKIKLDTLGLSGLPVNIAGVMYCDDEVGNSILGAMEPHAHDKFLPDLVAKKQVANVTVADAQKILKDLDKFKRKVLMELREKYTEEAESIDIVDDLFSSILGSGKGSGAGKTIRSEQETFNRKTYEVDYDGKFASNSRNSVVDNSTDVDLGEEDGPGVGTGKTGGKGVRGGDGEKVDEGGGSTTSKKKVKGKINKNVSSRFFISESSAESNTYKLVLRANEDFDLFNVVFSQHGDSGRKDSEMSSVLKSVKAGGVEVDFNKVKNNSDQTIGYKLKGLSVVKGVPSVYEVEMEENSTSALQIIEVI